MRDLQPQRQLKPQRTLEPKRQLNWDYKLLRSGRNYRETGNWVASNLTGYAGDSTTYSATAGHSAEWSRYADKTGVYNVYVWYPLGPSTDQAEYIVTSLGGTWLRYVDQTKNTDKWVKIATITAEAGTVMSVTLNVLKGNTRAGQVRFEYTTVDKPDDMGAGVTDTETIGVYLNQSGFDTLKSKRATVTNVPDNTVFEIKTKSNDAVVHTGKIKDQIADFTSYQTSGEYYLECSGKKSFVFSIGKYLTQRVSVGPALRFMDQSRSDVFLTGANGVAWRDSHQFSFELESLTQQYQANPSIYDRMPMGISNLATSQYPELRTQTEPDIIWLLKFAVLRYWDLWANQGKKHHALIKAQLPYFLMLYPDIKQHVSESFYTKIRDFAVAVWAEPQSNYHWYETDAFHQLTTDNNLLEVQSKIGGIKGEKPPGYAIRPNLLMYEVAKRDNLPNPQQYLNAAYNNAKWLIDSVNLDDPAMTKGQRMSEYVTMQGLAYFIEVYPSQAPAGIREKINRWVDLMIKRSNNLWDLRKYADPNDGTGTLDQWTGGMIRYNEPGNLAGFLSAAYAASRVITDSTKKARIKEIGIAQLDNMFGRNPMNRHFSYDGPTQIEGVDQGWTTFYVGGAGILQDVVGVIDGAPKEFAYPYNPKAPGGYTEGWVAFNTCWNSSLAYHAADETEITATRSGTTITVTLRAALNVDSTKAETGQVDVLTSSGATSKLTVTEKSVDDYYFTGTYTVPNGVTWVEFSYGYGLFKKSARIPVI
ncbi:cellulase N-terminal Ig-like domain-containing protein [Paenibacillus illinoisensis]|uniref:Cellulase N-terminal Ig-like domain-containing protein n=1 Tax=Paenibacillus illinoisensis TaxID=59845 RepID=A0ABW8HYP4_9BACL